MEIRIRVKSIAFVAGVGSWTAVTLAGSIFTIFNNPITRPLTAQSQPPSSLIITLLIAFMFVLGAIGGGLWGGGIAWLMKCDLKSVAMSSALFWGGSILAAGIALAFSESLRDLGALVKISQHYLHFFFTLVFVPTVGIVVIVNTRNVTAKLGLESVKNEVARKSGLAAALAFLVVSLVLLFGLGWEIGRPGFFAGFRYSMLVIMHCCIFAAALAGGLAMGLVFARKQVSLQPDIVD